MTRPNHVMIDYESLQPTDLALLFKHDQFRVTVFVGAQQRRIDLALVKALQPFGMRGDYIQIDGTGPNALDFHIAYYIGKLSEQQPGTFFHIVSSDHGFDPLIRHLKAASINALRCEAIRDIPLVKQGLAVGVDERAELTVQNLISRAHSRPATRKALLRTINALFPSSSLDDALAVVDALHARALLSFTDERVAYHFGD